MRSSEERRRWDLRARVEDRLEHIGLALVPALASQDERAPVALLLDAIAASSCAWYVPPVLWTAASRAVASSSREVRASAATLVAELLDDARTGPPRGYLALAYALEKGGHAALFLRALRAADDAKEPGAREELTQALVRQAWKLAAEGQRDAAIQVLREAKEFFS